MAPTAEFVLDNEVRYDADALLERVREQSRESFPLDATALAERVLGDAIATNSVVLGHAFQRGLVPASLEALERAIELNGVAVEANLRAFALGRLAAHDPEAVRLPERTPAPAADLDALVERLHQQVVGVLPELFQSGFARRALAPDQFVADVERRV